MTEDEFYQQAYPLVHAMLLSRTPSFRPVLILFHCGLLFVRPPSSSHLKPNQVRNIHTNNCPETTSFKFKLYLSYFSRLFIMSLNPLPHT